MSNKREKCWFCGGEDFEEDERGYHCLTCGTTFNQINKPGAGLVVLESFVRDPAYSEVKRSSYRPNASRARATARQKK